MSLNVVRQAFNSRTSHGGSNDSRRYEPLPIETRGIGPPRLPGDSGQSSQTRSLVLKWLLHCDDADARWLFNRLAAERPNLLDVANAVAFNAGFGEDLSDSHCPGAASSGRSDCDASIATPGWRPLEIRASPRQIGVSPRPLALFCAAEGGAGERVVQRTMPGDPDAGGPFGYGSGPIVQFSAPQYYCIEDEGEINLDVVRIGDLSSRSEVPYASEDASARAGETYTAVKGVLVFEEFEREKMLRVPLVPNDKWDTTLEFSVKLQEDGCENAVLGRYLWQARVKVIDNDGFPTNRFQREIESAIRDNKDCLRDVVPIHLVLWEYFKMNASNPAIYWGSLKCIFSDQFDNLYLIFKLCINLYLVDHVLHTVGGSEEARGADLNGTMTRDEELAHKHEELMMVVAGIVVPFAVLHYLDFLRPSWKVAGISRKTLQSAILRKFLNYTDESRGRLMPADLTLAMTRDAVNVVHCGYMQIFALIKSFGNIVMLVMFTLLVPIVKGNPVTFVVLIPALGIPVLLSCFIATRSRVTVRFLTERNKQQDALISHVESSVSNYRLIADFSRRSLFVNRFEDCIALYNRAVMLTLQVLLNNSMFAPWLTTIVVAAYTLFGGLEVVDGQMTLGMFLTNINVFTQVGMCWSLIYQCLLEMQMVFPEIERVTMLVNMPIDLPKRREMNRARRIRTAKLTTIGFMRGGLEKPGLSVDMLPIQIPTAVSGLETMDIQQGHLVTLVGPPGQGKSVLLKLLGGVTLPANASEPGFFVPSHLRILHVSAECLFFHGSLYENLTFGVATGDRDGDMSRVVEVCRRLGLPARVLRIVEQDTGPKDWAQALSHNKRQILNLARAVISNPEVLLMHSPMQQLATDAAEVAMGLLKEFCRNRGVEQDAASLSYRRPRTILISSEQQEGPVVGLADLCLDVTSEFGVRKMHIVADGSRVVFALRAADGPPDAAATSLSRPSSQAEGSQAAVGGLHAKARSQQTMRQATQQEAQQGEQYPTPSTRNSPGLP